MGGGGKKGGKKGGSKKKKSYSKAQRMAKARIAAKKNAPKAAKTKSTPASTGRAPSKTPTKAQNIAKARIAAGKTISQVKAANKKSMQDAASARNQKFKQTGVQTFGGKKTNFTKAEQKRITDAGYKVSGYSKAPAKSETQRQVDKDNQMYGNTVPTGSFNISEEGKALAAQQRAEAAAKKAAEKRAADAKLARQFSPDRLLNMRQLFDVGNIMAPGGDMASWYNQGADPTKSFRQVLGDEINMSQRTQGVGKGAWNPARGMPGYGSIRNVLTGKPFNTKFEGGFETGPTEANRRVFNNLGKVAIGKALFDQGRTGSITDQTVSNVPNVNVGGLSIGFKSPESTDIGAQAGKFITSIPSKISNLFSGGENIASAGGLNIGGSVDSEKASSKTGRTLVDRAKRPGFDTVLGAVDFGIGAITGEERTDLDRMGKGLLGKNLITPRDTVKDAGMLIGKVRNNELSRQDITQGAKDVYNIATSGDRLNTIANMPTKDLERLATKGYDVAKDSAVVQTAGERLGLPKDFKQQADTLRNEVKDKYLSGVKIGDRDSTYKAISDFNRDLGINPNLSLAARQAEAFASGKGTTMEKIAAGFQPGAAQAKGLSAEQRGIVGSIGNRLISGKQTDIAREAMTGMTPGSSLTAGNLTGIAQNVIKNTLPGADTVSAKRASEIKNMVTGGDVTPGSLIRGVNPFGGVKGSNRSSTSQRGLSIGASGGTPFQSVDAAPVTPMEELYIPEIPPQTGTSPNTLADIQNQSYQNTFNSLMAINPNYSAQFRLQPLNANRKGSFQRTFNRRYF